MNQELKEYLEEQFERSAIIAGGYTLLSVSIACVLAGISLNIGLLIIYGIISLCIGIWYIIWPDKPAKISSWIRRNKRGF